MRKKLFIAVPLVATLATTGQAAPVTGDPPSVAPSRTVSTSAPAGQDRVRISVSVINYPGVPERSSCRLLFRAVNETAERVELATLLHTFDSFKADLNSWLIPTGEMVPGQQIERLYSCKGGRFLALDQGSDYGWPTTCAVGGQRVSPCPVALKFDSNLEILRKD